MRDCAETANTFDGFRACILAATTACEIAPPPPPAGSACTRTQGYWKNHASAWPVASLALGNVIYTQAELLVILDTPVRGDGLVSLAHQLIAAKLNVAAGTDPILAIAQADALIGDLRVGVDSLATSETSSVASVLDAYNNGATGPGSCG